MKRHDLFQQNQIQNIHQQKLILHSNIRLFRNYSSHRSQQHNELFHCPLPPSGLKAFSHSHPKTGTVWSTGVLKRSKDTGKGRRCGKWFQEVDLYQQKDWTQAHKMSWMERTTGQVLLYPPDGLDYKVKNQFCVIVWQRVWICYIFHLSEHLKNSAFSWVEDKERERSGHARSSSWLSCPLPSIARAQCLDYILVCYKSSLSSKVWDPAGLHVKTFVLNEKNQIKDGKEKESPRQTKAVTDLTFTPDDPKEGQDEVWSQSGKFGGEYAVRSVYTGEKNQTYAGLFKSTECRKHAVINDRSFKT